MLQYGKGRRHSHSVMLLQSKWHNGSLFAMCRFRCILCYSSSFLPVGRVFMQSCCSKAILVRVHTCFSRKKGRSTGPFMVSEWEQYKHYNSQNGALGPSASRVSPDVHSWCHRVQKISRFCAFLSLKSCPLRAEMLFGLEPEPDLEAMFGLDLFLKFLRKKCSGSRC